MMETYTGTVFKATSDIPLGLPLDQKPRSKNVLIKDILKNSPFALTDLQVGFVVKSINGEVVTGNVRKAASMLKEAKGEVEIEAQGNMIQVTKPNKRAKVGVGFVYSEALDAVIVSSIAPNSLLKDTALKVGQQVTAVNGQYCLHDASSVTECVRNARSEFSLVTVNPDVTSVSITKSKGENAGIILKQHRDFQDKVIISSFADDSLFAGSDLKVGQQIVGINHSKCPRDSFEAAMMIRSAGGTLVVEAIDCLPEEISDAPDLLLSSGSEGSLESLGHLVEATKPSKDAKVGVGFVYSTPLDAIIINSIAPDSLLKDTPIKVGQKLVAVNGMEYLRDVKEVGAAIRNAESEIRLVVADPDFTRVSITKSKGENAGIILKHHPVYQDTVVISSIDKDGHFGSTDLKAGQQIIGIGGVVCPMDAFDAAMMIRSAGGSLVIEATEGPPDEAPHTAPVSEPKKPKVVAEPMVFAIMSYGHEVIRDAMREVRSAIASGDVKKSRKAWYVLRAWSTLHHKLEEGVGTDPSVSPKGFFRVLDEKCNGIATDSGLLDQHTLLDLAEANVTKALLIGDLHEGKTAFETFERQNLGHLKWEEAIMMPEIRRLQKACVPLRKIMREEILPLMTEDEMAFSIEFALQHLSRKKNAETVRTFAHALWGAVTPQDWDNQYHDYVKANVPTDVYKEMEHLFVQS